MNRRKNKKMSNIQLVALILKVISGGIIFYNAIFAYNGVLNDICRYEEKCRKWNTEIDHSLIMYKHYEEISKKILEIEHNQ